MKQYILLSLLGVLVLGMGCKKEDDELQLTGQEIAMEDILAESIELTLNPYENAPLAAEAIINTTGPTMITVQIGLENGLIHEASQTAELHKVPVLGLYPDALNTIIITITAENGDFAKDTLELETNPLPDYLPSIDILTLKENRSEPGFTLCEFLHAKTGKMIARPFLFDSAGRIRWYLELKEIENFINPIKRLRNGNWLFALNQTLYEYDMLGRQINTWEIEGYLQHHEVVEKEDGNFLVAVTKKDLETIEDHIIEIGRISGEILRVWDLREILDIDRFDLFWNSRDWLHVNSLWYDEADGGIIISGRHQGIFKVSRDNRLIWILAPHKGWGSAGLDGTGKPTSNYLLTAVNEEGTPFVEAVQHGEERALNFDWTWGQHAAMALPNGNILAFDNGFNRFFRPGTTPKHSRGVEYKIDEENFTVQQVWEYVSTEPGTFYSRNLGDADYLPITDNRLFCSGNIHHNGERYARIVELAAPEADVIFEAQINYSNIHSTGSDTWGQTDMVYRAERLPIYPE